jgi:hypothetical protein
VVEDAEADGRLLPGGSLLKELQEIPDGFGFAVL